jgi:hypothetical protein
MRREEAWKFPASFRHTVPHGHATHARPNHGRDCSLKTLAQSVVAEHRGVLAAARSALRHARSAGRFLLTAKERLAHGEWLPWLKDHCKLSPRRAQLYMQVARQWPQLAKLNAQHVSHLSLKTALRFIARPRPGDVADRTGPRQENLENKPDSTSPHCPVVVVQKNEADNTTARPLVVEVVFKKTES